MGNGPVRISNFKRHELMSNATTWLQALLTISILALSEGALLLVQRRHPARLARPAHADLREEWLAALSEHPGSDVLAV